MFLTTSLISLLACSGGKDPIEEPASEPSQPEDTEPTAPGLEAVYEGPVQAAFLIDHQAAGAGEASTAAYGVFLDSEQPYPNSILCMFYRFCEDFSGDIVNLSEAASFDFESYLPRYVGEVSLNGSEMTTDVFYENYELRIYFSDSLSYAAGDSFGLTLPTGEQYPSGYTSEVDIIAPADVAITSHDPAAGISGSGFGGGLLADERVIDLAWEAATDTTMLLRVVHNDIGYVTQIDDSGSYTLDFAAWGIVDEGQATVALHRIANSTVTVDEQEVQYTSMSSQFLSTNLTSLEVLDNPIDTADTCDDYSGLNSVGSGEHSFGGLVSPDWTDDVNTTCSEFGSVGVDAWAKIELGANETIIASYRLGQGDAVLYLTQNCGDEECLAFSDLVAPAVETIQYTNDTGGWSSFALGLDLFEENGIETVLPDDYLLDIWIGELAEAPLVDTCAEANGAVSTTTGSHYFGGNFSADFNHDIDTAANSWTAYDSLGPDGLMPVTLAAGETISASLTFVENDAVLYLLPDCAGTEAADAADDTVNGQAEEISYTNESGGEETLYLGVDMWENADYPHVPNDSYTLSVTIQ